MICKLCNSNEANKKNTHYLTDAIIRSCLNFEGSKQREKGLYFSMNNSDPVVEMNFQRLDEVTLDNLMGRKPTDEEIEAAKSIPFSVDYVFCKSCEEIFTIIENDFINRILPSLREKNLDGIEYLSFKDKFICRDFFYIQIFRSSVCENVLNISAKFLEKLRDIIYSRKKDDTIPMVITYLETKEQIEFTENFVGFTDDSNPYIIFMNDFVIQVFEDMKSVNAINFYGLNTPDFEEYVNFEEETFKMKILSSQKRKEFLNLFIRNEKVKKSLMYYQEMFDQLWIKLFGVNAPLLQKIKYTHHLVHGQPDNVLKFSKKEVFEFTLKYLVELFQVKD